MQLFLRHTRLWFLILCLTGHGFMPLNAYAGTRIWMSSMDICFSSPDTAPSSDAPVHHPLCCCQVSQDHYGLPPTALTYATPVSIERDTQRFHIKRSKSQTIWHIRPRGPPEQVFVA
jgi:hypothetical protein